MYQTKHLQLYVAKHVHRKPQFSIQFSGKVQSNKKHTFDRIHVYDRWPLPRIGSCSFVPGVSWVILCIEWLLWKPAACSRTNLAQMSSVIGAISLAIIPYPNAIQYPNAAHIRCSTSFDANTNSLSEILNHAFLYITACMWGRQNHSGHWNSRWLIFFFKQ